jgi:hypothetical protein
MVREQGEAQVVGVVAHHGSRALGPREFGVLKRRDRGGRPADRIDSELGIDLFADLAVGIDHRDVVLACSQAAGEAPPDDSGSGYHYPHRSLSFCDLLRFISTRGC